MDKVIYHDQNKGKGSAIKNALSFVTGNVVIIQDAIIPPYCIIKYSLLK